jgi:hypothetical protein
MLTIIKKYAGFEERKITAQHDGSVKCMFS